MDRVSEGWVSLARLMVICGCGFLFPGDGFWNVAGTVGVILTGIMLTWQGARLKTGASLLVVVVELVGLASCAVLVGKFLEFAGTREWGAVFCERVGALLAMAVCGGMAFGVVSPRVRLPGRLWHVAGAVLALALVSAMVLTVTGLPLSAAVPAEGGHLDIPPEWTGPLTAGLVAGGVIGLAVAMLARRREDALSALVASIALRVAAAVGLAAGFWGCVFALGGGEPLPAQAEFPVMTIMTAWFLVMMSAVLDGFALARSGILWSHRGRRPEAGATR